MGHRKDQTRILKDMEMKRIRSLFYLFATSIVLWVGCVDDPKEGHSATVPVRGSVTLNISLPRPVQKELNTRAGATDFDALNNLNVVVADGNDIVACEYFAALTGDPDTDPAAWYRNPDGSLSVHFSPKWLEYWGAAPTQTFYLIGNYGRRLTGEELTDVGTLRKLKDSSAPGMEGWVGSAHMMFGRTEDPVSNPVHTHDGGVSLQARMVRTAAMITVRIDGSQLARGVVITPRSISLHNVPTWCYLGEENIVTEAPLSTIPLPGAVHPDGEYLDVAGDLQWGAITGVASKTAPLNLPLPTSVGAHYTDWKESESTPNPPTVIDWEAGLRPLFMYENVHGVNFGASNTEGGQKDKRPAGVPLAREDMTAFETATRACSYLEVRASYQKLDDSGNLKMGGDVSFRVFLGGDVFENFDVRRNSYYRLTLTLRGNAVTEGGQIDSNGNLTVNSDAVTWRVESDLSSSSVLSESDFVLNAGGEMIFIDELMQRPNSSGWSVTYAGRTQGQVNNNRTYLYLIAGKQGDPSWQAFPLNSGGFGEDKLNTTAPVGPQGNNNMQYRLYVLPMSPTDGDGYMRRITFYLGNQSGYQSDSVTIIQYAPIRKTIPDDGSVSPKIRNYVTNVLRMNLPLTIYLDRVDREGMPWGFGGVNVAENRNSGFENGRMLMTPPHQAAAATYLPFGKPNSAMMHAAFMNYYQMAIPTGFETVNPAPNPAIGAMAGATLPVEFDFVPNTIPSRAEWKLLEMLQKEEGGLFDSRHLLMPWFSYWTSDAVVPGDTRAYVYQTEQGLDRTAEDLADYPVRYAADRTMPMRYRMVSFVWE
jgi:hypothetical protein